MKVITTIILTVALNMLHHPTVIAQNNAVPFTAQSPSFASSTTSISVRIIRFSASLNNDKVVLDWTVDQNQEATQFEIERSIDGKNFKMAALVFGTDKSDTATYQFFEKTKNTKQSYRLKILYKNGTIEYSPAIKAEAVNPTRE